MILYLGLTVVTVAAAYFVNNKVTVQPYSVSRQQLCNRILTAGIFALLFAVSACRIAVGNDYREYIEIFENIHQNRHVSSEPGFNLVVRIVQYFLGVGQTSHLTIFAIFSFATVYFFLHAIYDQSEWFIWSVFLWMAGGYYFSSLNTVRYYFVLSVALYAMRYAVKKQWLPFVLWIVFAAFFHKTVLFVIPVYWLAMRKWKTWHILPVAGFCVTFLVFQDIYRRIIFFFYPFYENSMFDTGRTSPINILKCLGVLVLSLLYYRHAIKDNRSAQFYFYLNLGALLLYVFCSFIPEVSRIGYYLNVTNIFLIPTVLKAIPDKKQKIFFSSVTALAFSLYLLMFLLRSYDVSIRLLPYRSWIFN